MNLRSHSSCWSCLELLNSAPVFHHIQFDAFVSCVACLQCDLQKPRDRSIEKRTTCNKGLCNAWNRWVIRQSYTVNSIALHEWDVSAFHRSPINIKLLKIRYSNSNWESFHCHSFTNPYELLDAAKNEKFRLCFLRCICFASRFNNFE